MVVKCGHRLFGKVQLLDLKGNIIGSCYSYNTKTKLAKLYIIGKTKKGKPAVVVIGKTFIGPESKDNKTLRVSVKIPGSKLVFKSTGKEVK